LNTTYGETILGVFHALVNSEQNVWFLSFFSAKVSSASYAWPFNTLPPLIGLPGSMFGIQVPLVTQLGLASPWRKPQAHNSIPAPNSSSPSHLCRCQITWGVHNNNQQFLQYEYDNGQNAENRMLVFYSPESLERLANARGCPGAGFSFWSVVLRFPLHPMLDRLTHFHHWLVSLVACLVYRYPW
jgi:hypothetical protein